MSLDIFQPLRIDSEPRSLVDLFRRRENGPNSEYGTKSFLVVEIFKRPAEMATMTHSLPLSVLEIREFLDSSCIYLTRVISVSSQRAMCV